MKIKIIIGSFLLALGASAYAYHSHSWQLVNEFEGQHGKKVCNWECYGGHFTTTSGYGYCGRPSY